MNDVDPCLQLFPTSTDTTASSVTNGKVTTGVLPYQALVAMVRANEIAASPETEGDQIQPASMDLRLGRFAYQVRASFLPGASTVLDKVEQMDGAPRIDLLEGAVLHRGAVYVVELLENVRLPSTVSGFANPNSSTGRLDVLTRLITDESNAFDRIERGYKGKLYVEVAPQTFSVVVRQGSRLNQVRFQRGNPVISGSHLQDLYEKGQLVRHVGPMQRIHDHYVPVTIDLKGNGPGSVIGYRAKKHS